MHSFIKGFLLPFQSIGLLRQTGIRPYVVWPLILNIVLFVLLAWVSSEYFGFFMDQYLPEEAWWSFMRPVLWVFFALIYLFIVFYGFTILANLVASPFNSVLAARAEKHFTGKLPDAASKGFIEDIGIAVGGEINKLVYFLLRALPLLLLFVVAVFIPGLNLLVGWLWIGFGLWFLALEYADYPMGNHAIKPKEQRRILAKHRMQSLGLGAGVSVLMMIPILGFVAMPAAVVGATRYWVEDMSADL